MIIPCRIDYAVNSADAPQHSNNTRDEGDEPAQTPHEREGCRTLQVEPQQARQDKGGGRDTDGSDEAKNVAKEGDHATDKACGADVQNTDDLAPYCGAHAVQHPAEK